MRLGTTTRREESFFRGANPVVAEDEATGVAVVSLMEGTARGVSGEGDTARCWRRL